MMTKSDAWASAYEKRDTPRPPNKHLVAALSQLDPLPRGSALDLACGAGRHLPLLIEHGLTPTGIDLSPLALDSSQRFGYDAPLAQANAKALPFVDDAFVLIIAWGILFHLNPDQQNKMLREIHRTLVKQGVAILHALDPGDWRRDLDAGPEHRRAVARKQTTAFYTHAEIATLCGLHFNIISQNLVSSQHDYGQSAEWVIAVRKD